MDKILEKESDSAWYLVKTFPGKETNAVDFIKNIAIEENCVDDVIDFFIPQCQNKKSEYASVMMGYFAMNLRLTPQFLKVVDKVENSKVHLGGTKIDKKGKTVHSKSITTHKITFYIKKKMTQSDLNRMMESSNVYNEIKNVYHIGERVVIIDGPLKDLRGTIKKMHGNDKLCLDVVIVSRNVLIELDMSKIKKED